MIMPLRRMVRLLSIAILIAASAAHAQTIETIAGSPNYTGVPGTSVPIHPRGVVLAPDGTVFVSDVAGNRVLRYNPADGTVTNIAGTGTWGFSGDGGPAVSAALSDPRSLALDPAGNLYIADGGSMRIRRVNASTGVITTVAGNGSWGY